jgi:hypothetical protein
MLADHGTKSYIVGSTNSLLLQQKDRYSDILINVSSSMLQKTRLIILWDFKICLLQIRQLDEHTINISSTSLRTALILSTPDRRWIDFLTQVVNDTWDECKSAINIH